jgi:hypothetical protein
MVKIPSGGELKKQKEERTSFSEEKEAKRLLLRFARVWHQQCHTEHSKFFLLLFCSQKRRLPSLT